MARTKETARKSAGRWKRLLDCFYKAYQHVIFLIKKAGPAPRTSRGRPSPRPTTPSQRLAKVDKSKRFAFLAGEDGGEGYVPFRFCSTGQRANENHAARGDDLLGDDDNTDDRLVVGPRPKHVGHCPTSFPCAPSEKFHKRNLMHMQLLTDSGRQRKSPWATQAELGHEHSPCSPLRWGSCDHLFYQDFLWENRFRFVDPRTGRPYSLLLLTMKALADVMSHSQLCLVNMFLALVC